MKVLKDRVPSYDTDKKTIRLIAPSPHPTSSTEFSANPIRGRLPTLRHITVVSIYIYITVTSLAFTRRTPDSPPARARTNEKGQIEDATTSLFRVQLGTCPLGRTPPQLCIYPGSRTYGRTNCVRHTDPFEKQYITVLARGRWYGLGAGKIVPRRGKPSPSAELTHHLKLAMAPRLEPRLRIVGSVKKMPDPASTTHLGFNHMAYHDLRGASWGLYLCLSTPGSRMRCVADPRHYWCQRARLSCLSHKTADLINDTFFLVTCAQFVDNRCFWQVLTAMV